MPRSLRQLAHQALDGLRTARGVRAVSLIPSPGLEIQTCAPMRRGSLAPVGYKWALVDSFAQPACGSPAWNNCMISVFIASPWCQVGRPRHGK